MKAHRIPLGHATSTAGIVALLFAEGCSLLYDFGTKQCNVDGDCLRLGQQFEHTVCRSHACVAQAATGGSSSTTSAQAGSNDLGGGSSSTAGIGNAGTSSNLAGAGAGGTAGSPGSAGTAGSDAIAGSGAIAGQPSCSNDQCIKDHNSPSWVCRNNACVNLVTEDCPVLIPRSELSTLLPKQDAIVVGGYATMANNANFYDSQAVANWDLAFQEFNDASFGGLPGLGSGGQRPLIGLICRGNGIGSDVVTRTMKHLTETAQVSAVLSTLSADDLYQAWLSLNPDGTASSNTSKPIFFMSTGSADSRLASLTDDDLMWHMLGDPRTLAAPVVALLKQIEPFVNAQRAANFVATQTDDPATVPLRVTLVHSDEPLMSDIARVLVSREDPNRPGTMLFFNGKSVLESSDNFRSVEIQSIRVHNPADVAAGIQDLASYPPHVIVAMATAEFASSVLSSVEGTWTQKAPGRIRPYYVMSHLLYNTNELSNAAKIYSGAIKPNLDQRVVGVNWASAQDKRAQDLYASYLIKLKEKYGSATVPLDGTENNYDGAYYLLYSLSSAAAFYSSPTGAQIADALKTRIISSVSGVSSIDVGPTALSGSGTGSGTLYRLFSEKLTFKMSLYGTMGPPDFDRFSGTRISATSAWCLKPNTDGKTWSYKADGLIFDAATQTYAPPAAGIPSCLQSYCNSLTTEGKPVCRLDY